MELRHFKHILSHLWRHILGAFSQNYGGISGHIKLSIGW